MVSGTDTGAGPLEGVAIETGSQISPGYVSAMFSKVP